MANMAYFNGTNAQIGFDDFNFTNGGFRAVFTILIKATEKPAAGNYYPLGIARINSAGHICINDGTGAYSIEGSIDLATGSPLVCEISIISNVVTVTVGGTPDTGLSSTSSTWTINQPPRIGNDGTMWLKGFFSNYEIYDNMDTLVFSLPLTSDFISTAGTGTVKPNCVTIFDTADLPYATQLSSDSDAKNLGFYFNIATWYHYWCNENESVIGSCIHVGHGSLYERSGGIMHFPLATAIPQGSRITEAYLIMTALADSGSNTPLIAAEGARSRITGWKTASPYAFDDWTAYKAIRGTVTGGATDSNLTDNQVNLDLGESETINAGEVYTSPSLINIIQEIVNLGNISNIALFWDDHEGRSANGYGFHADYAIYLIVKYNAEDIECNVTYNVNGGTGDVPTNSTPYEPGDDVEIESGEGLSNSGYDFIGWTTRPDGTGTVFQEDDIFIIQASTVLYAKWAEQLTVTYSANDAESGDAPEDSNTYNPGDEIIVLGNTGDLTRTGYTFRSWNTAADGSGVTYLAGSRLTLTDSITLYANWDLAIYSSEVFGVVGGNNAWHGPLPVPEAVENPIVGNLEYVSQIGYAIRFVLPYVIPRGTIIKSASLQGTGGVVVGISGTVQSEGTSCFIRAQLASAPTSISSLNDYMNRRGLGGNAGQVTTTAADFSERTDITPGEAFEPVSLVSVLQEVVNEGDVSSILLFIDDHEGNSDENNAYSLALPMGLSYSYDCTLAYNGNGSTGGTVPIGGSTTYTYGDPIIVPGNTGSLTKVGYTFVKWNTKADGTGTDYEAGDTLIISANTILYAQWASSVSSDIFFVGYSETGEQWMQILIPDMAPNPGVGNIIGADMTKFGYAVRFVLPAPIPMGATITSASLHGTGGQSFNDMLPEDVEFDDGNGTMCLIRAQANVAPTAIADLTDYRSRRGLIEDGNGTVNESTGHVTTASVPFNDALINTPGVPFVTGSLVSVLQELADAGDVSSVVLFVDDHEGNSDPNHLYSIAMSQELNYEYSCKITYDGNGNTGGTTPVDHQSPYSNFDSVSVLGNKGLLTKHGYTFSKWNTAADGSGTDYDPGDTFTITADTILYAQWKVAVSKVVTIVAWDTVNERGKTGDAANIEICGVRDGLEYVPEAPDVTEVNAVRMPGVYTVSLTKMENDCYFNTVGGTSSTTGVVIKPTFWRNEEDGKLLRLLLREILNEH